MGNCFFVYLLLLPDTISIYCKISVINKEEIYELLVEEWFWGWSCWQKLFWKCSTCWHTYSRGNLYVQTGYGHKHRIPLYCILVERKPLTDEFTNTPTLWEFPLDKFCINVCGWKIPSIDKGKAKKWHCTNLIISVNTLLLAFLLFFISFFYHIFYSSTGKCCWCQERMWMSCSVILMISANDCLDGGGNNCM